MRCSTGGCEKEARWIPEVKIYAFRHRDPNATRPIRATPALGFCDECREKATSDSVLTDEAFEGLCLQAVGNWSVVPDRSRTVLTWVSVDSSDPFIAQMATIASVEQQQSDATGSP